MNIKYLSMSQLAEVTGFDRRTVKDRLATLKPEKTLGKAIIYDAHKALPLLYKLETDDIKEQLLAESLRLEKGRADKIELELAKTRGEQVSIEDVALVVQKEYSRVRAQLVSIPTKLAKDLSLIDDPRLIQVELENAVNEALSELSADEKYKNQEIPEIEKEELDEGTSVNSGESSPS